MTLVLSSLETSKAIGNTVTAEMTVPAKHHWNVNKIVKTLVVD
jgi:hypothetical protein